MKQQLLNYFTSFCFAILAVSSQAQQAIHDAYSLRELMVNDSIIKNDELSSEKLAAILARHFDTKETGLSNGAIIEAYRDNPFLSSFLPQYLPNGEDAFLGETGARGDLSAISSGLGLPGSTFLMGLTEFLVKRTKEELTIAFFRDFQKIVHESEELKYLFPSTSKVLLKIGEDVYQIKAFWEVLRGSFLKDLEDLVHNLDDYVQNSSRIKDVVVKDIMSDFFRVIELFYDKTPPTEVVRYLANDAYLHLLAGDASGPSFVPILQSSLKVLGVLSKSLESADADGYWVNPDLVLKMVKDPLFSALYLGLVYQEGKNIKMGDKTFSEHLKTLSGDGNAEKSKELMSIIRSFINEAKVLKRLTEDMRSKTNDRRRNRSAEPLTDSDKELEYDEYFEFTQGVCNMLGYAHRFKKVIIGEHPKEDSLVSQYLSVIGDINGMALNIRKKYYTSALMNALFIIEKLLPQDSFMCERKVILKYGTFIATAVNAKTSSDVSNAISAFALPPGGSAIKKYSRFSIALNAYVGLAAGQEVLMGVDPQAFYAVTTPIGVTFNWGFKNFGSIGILASILDIGALTAFRFEDNNVSQLPDLKFENVLAPGGYIVYGVPKYPISIGIGAQMGPNLRTVTNGNLGISTTSGWRWGAFIAVDIPIVSLYTTNKNYKQCCKKCNSQNMKNSF